MEPNKPKVSAKDLFLNLGAFVALYTVVVSLINLLFTVINKAYPQVTTYYYGYNSYSNISWPVSIIIIFFPILIALYWFLEKEYQVNPERQRTGVHKWLSYITLFVSGIAFAGDLVAVLYYFLNGEELTVGFLLKVLVVLVISSALFIYFITDIRGRLNPGKRKVWRIISALIVIVSIVWGFSVLGSPRTQRLYKYDSEKINSLQNVRGQVESYYGMKTKLPTSLDDLKEVAYSSAPVDTQTNKPFEYIKTGEQTYKLCAEFNKSSEEGSGDTKFAAYPSYGDINWSHPAGRHCYDLKINPMMFPKAI